MPPGVSSQEQPATRVLPPTLINPVDETELLLVPAGNFLWGSLPSQGDPDERPQRDVYIDAFYIARHPVTNAQFRKFMKATGHPEPRHWKDHLFNADQQPVAGVSWEDADAYCKWAGLRLPTEAEWEKAASWDDASKLKRWWPWGDVEPDAEKANFGGKVGHTSPVGSYPLGASPYGCQDMAGNVYEWCQDWYLYNFYETAPDRNPAGPDQSPYKVLRGGSWSRPGSYITACNRYWYSVSYRDSETGFRCARKA